VRRQRTREFVTQSSVPLGLGQIPAMLGHTEQSTFIRSCLRWYGKTPGALRKEGVPG